MTKEHHPMEDEGDAVEDDFMRYASKWNKNSAAQHKDNHNRCCKCSWKACCISSTISWLIINIATWTTFGILVAQDYIDISFHDPGESPNTTTTITEYITPIVTSTATSIATLVSNTTELF
jgi:hypothetical protein